MLLPCCHNSDPSVQHVNGTLGVDTLRGGGHTQHAGCRSTSWHHATQDRDTWLKNLEVAGFWNDPCNACRSQLTAGGRRCVKPQVDKLLSYGVSTSENKLERWPQFRPLPPSSLTLFSPGALSFQGVQHPWTLARRLPGGLCSPCGIPTVTMDQTIQGHVLKQRG